MNNFTLIKQEKTGIVRYHVADYKFRLMAVAFAAVSLVFVTGAWIGSMLQDQSTAQNQTITDLQSLVDQRQQELMDHKASVQDDIDSMSLQVGKLMAQSTRLNALGTRLSAATNINPDEFSMDFEPGIGGASLELTGELNTPQSLYANLFNLEQNFSQQQEKFTILSQLLNEQTVDDSATPHVLPLEKGWISSYYGKRIDPFTGQQANHAGMDYSGAYQSKILAAADGVVVWAGMRSSYGNMVEIDHGNGFMTRYAHAESLQVELGQKVNAGEPIAIMGKSGRATSEHLHFEVLKNGHKVNPLPFINS